MAYDVDVVVVGGRVAGVAAAVSAAQAGADVFLLSECSYLGTDMCGTGRLSLKPGEKPETPLGEKIFTFQVRDFPDSLPFTYQADRESDQRHRDTGGLLADGLYNSAARRSVQYGDDVTVAVDIGEVRRVAAVHVLAYQRNGEFEVLNVSASCSVDSENWTELGQVANTKLGNGAFGQVPIDLSLPVGHPARHFRVTVRKNPSAERVLLGEIIIESEDLPAEKEAMEFSRPSPMHVKRVLDQALIDAGVEFLLGCMVTNVLRDRTGRPAGIVMANRSGRQAVRAKVIVDATDRACVTRMAGAEFTAYPSGPAQFRRMVTGGEAPEGDDRDVRILPPLRWKGKQLKNYEYALSIPMKDGSFASFARAEQVARDRTWHDKQAFAGEFLFQVPPDPVKGESSMSGSWPGADAAEIDAFRPRGIPNFFIAGGCADISREAAECMLRPLESIRLGNRLGQAAASEAASLPTPGAVEVVSEEPDGAATDADVREYLVDVFPFAGSGTGSQVISPAGSLPVLAEYDVVVVGGGTAGAPAGIAAARQGADTLVVEYLHGLGGMGTLGMINSYYHGNRVGFTEEIDATVGSRRWDPEEKMEWFRKELRKAGADIWFGSMGSGALVREQTVVGVVVVTPGGRGVVRCRTVIDATGNADIAMAAGAECRFIGADVFALQGTGLSSREPGQSYNNSDWTYVNDSDVIDRTRTFVTGRSKFDDQYDISPLIASRERRRIVGDYTLTPMDIITGRTYPDTIEKARSNFDTHGYTVHPLLRLAFPDKKVELNAYVPYRCLLPRGLDGILVVGLGASVHRDALPVVRMQPDIQNQGYAAGAAAAMAAESGRPLREIDIDQLQRHLVETGIIDSEVLSHASSGSMPDDQVTNAVNNLSSHNDYAVIFDAGKDRVVPLLRRRYREMEAPEQKLMYGRLLAAFGDDSAASRITEAVESGEWDQGWRFAGMGNFASGYSRYDSLIIALGETSVKEAVPLIIRKMNELTPKSEFSHFRACALALEQLGDPRAAEPLALVLKKEGIAGHEFLTVKDALAGTPAGKTDLSTRRGSLRELVLARALLRCGDYDGLGREILRRYADDVRGVYRLHARQVLEQE